MRSLFPSLCQVQAIHFEGSITFRSPCNALLPHFMFLDSTAVERSPFMKCRVQMATH